MDISNKGTAAVITGGTENRKSSLQRRWQIFCSGRLEKLAPSRLLLEKLWAQCKPTKQQGPQFNPNKLWIYSQPIALVLGLWFAFFFFLPWRLTNGLFDSQVAGEIPPVLVTTPWFFWGTMPLLCLCLVFQVLLTRSFSVAIPQYHRLNHL